MKIKRLILFSGAWIIMCLIALIKSDYDNHVIFTGDEWDYQSIGVNFYYGYEFLTTGRIKDSTEYKFKELNNEKIQFWESASGKKAYYRAPFYPLFICVIYKAFGINPLIVKYFQLFILILSGLLLVFIGKLAWGDSGYTIGSFSSIIFVSLNYRFAGHLMSENWQFLFLSIITICMFYHYKGNKSSSIILGITLGLSCLNKGTTFFLFPLIIIADLVYSRTKNRIHWQNMLLFAVAFTVITLLWSVYLSIERDQITYISSQTGEVLLDGNNEFCNDGLWHPEWRNIPGSFYNNDNLSGKPMILRVINFYKKNPLHLLNFPAKIKAGFASIHSFIATITLFLIFLSEYIYIKSGAITDNRSRIACKLFTLSLFCFSILFWFFSGALNSILFTTIVFALFFLIIFFPGRFSEELHLPFQFLLIFLNFITFTLAFYVCNETYPGRYVKTMDGIFILINIYLIFKIFDHLNHYYIKLRIR